MQLRVLATDDATPPRGSSRRIARAFVGGVVLLIVGGAIGWSVTTLLAPPKEVLQEIPYTYATAAEGSVGSTIAVTAVASWETSHVGTNRAAGTVTSMAWASGTEARPGDVLYSVDQRPVVVAAGNVPAYRDLTLGDRGEDVVQLQEMLRALGHQLSPDGIFRDSTRRAVIAWQKSLGVDATGAVGVGGIVFVPSLPARLTLDAEAIFRGAIVGGGERAVLALGVAPRFAIPVTSPQAAAMREGARVSLTGPGESAWSATVQSIESTGDEIELILSGEGDAPICADTCSSIPSTGETLMPAMVTTVEPVAGTVIPTAALRTGADGGLSVIDRRGAAHDVTVLATARGMTAVSGIEPGIAVRIPGGD